MNSLVGGAVPPTMTPTAHMVWASAMDGSLRQVSLAALSPRHAGPLKERLELEDVYRCLRPADDVIRFALGRDFDQDEVRKRLNGITLGELGGGPVHAGFSVVNADLGVIEFGSTRPLRGDLPPPPVEVLERALGVKRLPESLCALPVNNVFLGTGDDNTYLRYLINLFGALAASGAVSRLEIDPGYTRERIIEGGHFYGRLDAQFVSDDERVALSFSTGELRWDAPRSFWRWWIDNFTFGFVRFPGRYSLLPDFARKTTFPIEVELLREDDRNTLEGHDILRRGFENLFKRFLANPSKHHFRLWFQNDFLRLGYFCVGAGIPHTSSLISFDQGLEAAMRAFQMDEFGQYYPRGGPPRVAGDDALQGSARSGSPPIIPRLRI